MALAKECLFCKIIRKEVPSTSVAENDMVYAFQDINPQAPVHVVLVPKDHIERVSDLTDRTRHYVGEMIFMANQIAATKKISESGYRLVVNCNRAAGQSVFHLHLHLLGGRQMTWPPG